MQRSAFLIPIVLLACVACGGDAGPAAAESGGEQALESAMALQEAPAAAGQARSAAAPAAARAAREPAAAAPPAAQRRRRLETFDMDALIWAMYHHAGVEPPIRDWVAANWRRSAYDRGEIVDEFFDSDAFIDGLEDELRPDYEAAADIGFARVPMRGELGTYDTQFEELYIEPFAPGSGVRAYSNTIQRETRLQFSNALDVYAWPLSPAEAQDVIARLPTDIMGRRNRAILLEVDLRLTGATVDSRTGNGRIDADIIGYQLFAPGPGGGRGELLREVKDIR
ncbi:MAG: hypothetical protein JJT88_11040 [Gammaproteobacteria bacterium]|nr:hypothetical protein [Gammaproteobacteria bacterium]